MSSSLNDSSLSTISLDSLPPASETVTALNRNFFIEENYHEIPPLNSTSNNYYTWYYAIGSMINPTSLSLRDLRPRLCFPGAINEWKIIFDGMGGMANIIKNEEKKEESHGVVHLMSNKHMAALDLIEGSYMRVAVAVHLYDGRIQMAYAYKMDETKIERKAGGALPSERYLDIIARGCEYYGVKKEYIDFLKSHPNIPRKKPSDYRSIPLDEEAEKKIFTLEELTKSDGRNGRPLRYAVNRKVFEWTGGDPDAVDSEGKPLLSGSQKMWYEWARNNSAGKDVTLRFTQMLYEPRYPIAKTFDDLTDEQKLWVEDNYYDRITNATLNGLRLYKCVGKLFVPPSSSSTVIPSPSSSSSSSSPSSSSPYSGSSSEPSHGDECLYFAIGAMCNPISISLRNIHSIEAWPAELPGYQISFNFVHGMANIIPNNHLSMHGVIHRLSIKDMDTLDKIERGYKRISVEAKLYDGKKQTVFVYIKDDLKIETNHTDLPTERYIDIIVRGLKHYHCKESYIKFISEQRSTPRKLPKDYKTIPISEEAKKIIYTSEKELEENDKKEKDHFLFVVNDKVLRFPLYSDDNKIKAMIEWLSIHARGKDFTAIYARMLYEPNYSIVKSTAEMTEEHRLYVEDQMADNNSSYTVIALFKQPPPPPSPSTTNTTSH